MEPQIPTKYPAISVIVLNWNGERYLERCLGAVAAQTYQDYELLVLDNASTDGSVDDLARRWPGIRLEKFSQNLGFAAGNNRGARLARGRWIALLNNDAFPDPEWLAQLARAAQAHPGYSFFS